MTTFSKIRRIYQDEMNLRSRLVLSLIQEGIDPSQAGRLLNQHKARAAKRKQDEVTRQMQADNAAGRISPMPERKLSRYGD